MKHPRLKNALLGIRSPEYFPRGPFGPRWFETAVLVAMKSVLTLQPTGHSFSYELGPPKNGQCFLRL